MVDIHEPLTAEQRGVVERNIRLALKLAHVMWLRNQDRIELEELEAAAKIGLIKAAQRFDPVRFAKTAESMVRTPANPDGKAFSGYARRLINGEMLEWQRGRDHVPKLKRQDYKKLQAHGLGTQRIPIHELAARAGLSEEKARQVIHMVEATAVSIDATPDHWEGDHQYGIEIHALHSVEEATVESDVQRAFVTAFTALPELQQTVIALALYGAPTIPEYERRAGLTVPEIATLIDVRPATVRAARDEGVLAIFAAIERRWLSVAPE